MLAARPNTLLPQPSDSRTGPAADIAAVCEDWPRLWNGEIEAQKLVAPTFQIWFGSSDQVTGVDAFAAVTRRAPVRRPGPVVRREAACRATRRP